MTFPWKNFTPLEENRQEAIEMLSHAFPATTSNKSWFTQTDKTFFDNHVINIGTTDLDEDLFVELTGEGFDLLRGVKINYNTLSDFEGYTRGVIICCAARTAESAEKTLDFR